MFIRRRATTAALFSLDKSQRHPGVRPDSHIKLPPIAFFGRYTVEA